MCGDFCRPHASLDAVIELPTQTIFHQVSWAAGSQGQALSRKYFPFLLVWLLLTRFTSLLALLSWTLPVGQPSMVREHPPLGHRVVILNELTCRQPQLLSGADFLSDARNPAM